jgi:hypothetical protein
MNGFQLREALVNDACVELRQAILGIRSGHCHAVGRDVRPVKSVDIVSTELWMQSYFYTW